MLTFYAFTYPIVVRKPIDKRKVKNDEQSYIV